MIDKLSALLVDAGGTLLQVAEPVGVTYARFARGYGVNRPAEAVEADFRAAFSAWQGPRYVGDGRPFWRAIVAAATGSDDPELFEALYAWYARPEAWTLAPGALETFAALRARGVTVAVVSNWDTRLRPLLGAMGVLPAIDAAVISAEVGLEKPDPALYRRACALLGVPPAEALHVGDHPRKDVEAARAAGCRALLWGVEITDLRVLQKPPPSSR